MSGKLEDTLIRIGEILRAATSAATTHAPPLFLRAERQPDGRRNYKLAEKTLPTSYGEDVYYRLGGWLEEDKEVAQAADRNSPHGETGLRIQARQASETLPRQRARQEPDEPLHIREQQHRSSSSRPARRPRFPI